jgi:signal peptidase
VSPARLLRLGAGGVAAGIAAGLVLAVVVLLALGYRGLTVLSGSMEPALSAGDVVVQHQVSPRSLAVGDVVTFRDPEGGGRLITHRVRGVVERDGRVEVITRGDANSGSERWSVPADGRLGRVVARVPHLGRALAWTHGGLAALALLLVVPASLLAGALAGRRPR